MKKSYRVATNLSGLVLILVALLTYSGLFLSGGILPWQGSTPPIWAPMAGLIFWPSYIGLLTVFSYGPFGNFDEFLNFGLFSLIPIFLASFFWISGRALFRGESNVPRWLIWATPAVGVLNVAYFVALWENALRYQGLAHTVVVIAENTVLFGAIVALYALARRRPSFGRNLLSRWLFFFWLVWCAFPFFGRLFGDTL
ncbi:MAG: hypothetical protein O7A62_05790 [Alphaproteobacteria bacterium]|nr:hypothetical protein [Alphaproteobacteria bacterium]MCZ6588019.1 hypothetical protein [Alphaproteobacteria bacterium]